MAAALAPSPLYPMPPGDGQERLRSDFVDLERVLATLEADRFTGYLRLFSAEVNSVVLLVDGGVVEAVFDSPLEVLTGSRALDLVAATVSAGEGEIDLVPVEAEVVIGLYQLLTAPSLYANLAARFVDLPALLDYLSETKASGSVVVTAGRDQGVVLLRDGDLLTAYTSRSSSPEAGPGMLRELCEAPGAAIDVRTGDLPGAMPRMELARALEIAREHGPRAEETRPDHP